MRGAQQKAAPCPRILGVSPRCGDVQARDVFVGKIGSVSERGKELERTKVSECAVHTKEALAITRHEDIQFICVHIIS